MLGAIRPTGAGGGGGAVASVFGRSGTVTAANNDYAASQISGLGGSAGPLVVTPSSTQALTAASTIAANSGTAPITAAIAITLTSNPQIATGANGQRITVVNVGSNAITFVSGNGLLLPQNIILYGGKLLSFTYSAAFSSWIYDALVPESIALTGVPTAPTAGMGTANTQIATTGFVSTAITRSCRPAIEVSRSTPQSINPYVFSRLIFDSIQIDTDNAYNSTTGVFTCPANQGGMYEVFVFAGIELGAVSIQFSPVRNGSAQNHLRQSEYNSSGNDLYFHSATFKIRLNAGDTFSIDLFYSSSSGTPTTTSMTQFPSLSLCKVYA